MNNTNKNPPSFESGFCLAPPAGLEPCNIFSQARIQSFSCEKHLPVRVSLRLKPSKKSETKTPTLRVSVFIWLPLLGSNHATYSRKREYKVFLAKNICPSGCHYGSSHQRKVKQKHPRICVSVFVWLPLLGSNQRHPD